MSGANSRIYGTCFCSTNNRITESISLRDGEREFEFFRGNVK